MERDEDWELCNEDGFVYKRTRRISDPGESSNPVDPESDPAVEERNRRKRKKITLVKLKSKYQREIQQWDILSNSFNATQERAVRFETTQQREDSLNANEATSFQEDGSPASVFLDELLSKAEAQDVIINDVSRLCEVAENIIRVEEEETKQLLFDLDVWSSPRNLMASLCAD
ncbi:Cryptic loci regulator [Hirschfeldia incana]|nr:Cryptic loci regulator [Hirschfeldia incana]